MPFSETPLSKTPLSNLRRVAALAGRICRPVLVTAAAVCFAHAGYTTSTALAITSGSPAAPASSVAAGTVVTLTATVKLTGLKGAPTPITVGLVNFCDASATYCEDIHILGSASLTSAGTAVFRFRPGAGTHSYTAVFAGTRSTSPAKLSSTSSAQSLTVVPGKMAPTVTASTIGTYPNLSLVATVTGTGAAAPTGRVSFLDSGNSNYALATVALDAGTANATFAASTAAAGVKPESVAVGDFNGDGIPDLAVANDGSSTVGVLLGQGPGTFSAQVAYSTGSNSGPVGVAVGDFNGDGIQDLAVANANVAKVGVLLGKGDGTFSTQVTYATGTAPQFVAVGDFNGDGIPDLAVVNQGSRTVGVLLGKGDGTFNTQVAYTLSGSYPYCVAVGDFNGDGIPDLAVANAASVGVLLGKGDGTFNTQVTYKVSGDPNSVTVGDFNGDGIADLATANLTGNSVSVLLGKGDGTFGTPVAYAVGSNPFSVIVGDLNGDGIADLAVANYNSANAGVLLGKGDGTFNAQVTYATDTEPGSVAAGDFNGDGYTDLTTTNVSASDVSVLLYQTFTASAAATLVDPVGTGADTVTPSYSGDSNYLFGSGSGIALTLQPAATTLTLTPSPSGSSTFGQQVALTATLSPYTAENYTTDGQPVSFYSGQTLLGTANLVTGQALLNVTSLPAGSDSLTATFAGTTDFAAATSTTVTFTVNPSTIPVTLTAANLTDYVGSTTQFQVAQLLSSFTAPSGYTAAVLESYLSNAEFGITVSGPGYSQNYPIFSYGTFVGGALLPSVSGTPDASYTLTPYLTGPGASQFAPTYVPGSVTILPAP